MTRVRPVPTAFLLLLLTLLALSLATARPAAADEVMRRAAEALRSSPVYVDPGAENLIDDAAADRLRSRVQAARTPTFVVVRRTISRNDYANANAFLSDLRRLTGRQGVYVIATPSGVYAGSDARGVTGSEATALANAAARSVDRDAIGDTLPAALEGLVDRVDTAAASGSAGSPGFPSGPGGGTSPFDRAGVGTGAGSGGGGGFSFVGIALLAMLGFGILRLARSGKRKAKAQAARVGQEFAEVRQAAEEDVTKLGEEITALDLDVSAKDVDDAERTDYVHALNSYDRAKAALEAARTPEDLGPVTEALEDGRYAMACVRARLANQPLPERRAPCFFNPQHGPSAQDVEWAPPGGAPRRVPACAADAESVAHGYSPESREVMVGGQRRPYWDAGPAFGPWAGGYYAGYGGMGGMLPGILVGTMLGGAMSGGFGFPGAIGVPMGGGGGYDDGGGFGGSFGGGGDFGGGGMFGGGGDFGGGFGGGGDFGGGGGDF